MSEASARLFVAAEVPEGIRTAFAGIRDDLARRMPAARWVRTEGMHLTFKFLGATPRSRISELGDALAGAVSRVAPLRLTTGETGVFGSPRRPRVVWLALDGDVDACVALAAAVEASLAPMGFPSEARPFRPHLTLARFPAERDSPIPGPTRPALEAALRGRAFPIAALVLFESFLGRGGARYEARRTCPLGSGAARRTAKDGEA